MSIVFFSKIVFGESVIILVDFDSFLELGGEKNQNISQQIFHMRVLRFIFLLSEKNFPSSFYNFSGNKILLFRPLGPFVVDHGTIQKLFHEKVMMIILNTVFFLKVSAG